MPPDSVAALFTEKTPAELASSLRVLAADARLDSMPSKFRCSMEAAATMLERLEVERRVAYQLGVAHARDGEQE